VFDAHRRCTNTMPQTIFRVGERVVTRDGFYAKIVSLEDRPAQHSDTFDQILVLDVASVGLREGVCASLVTPSRDRRVGMRPRALQPQKHASDAHARAMGHDDDAGRSEQPAEAAFGAHDNKLLKSQAEPPAIPHALMLWLSSLDDAGLRREFDAHADIPGRTAASADAAGERRMSRGGLAELLRDRGIAHGDTEVERVLARVDANEDGLINFGEFRALARANSDLEKVLRAKHLERVLCLFSPRGTTLEDLAAMSCAQLAAIVERSKEAQVQLLVDLAAQMKAVGTAQHAAGGGKFSGELKGGPLDDFFEGVTGVCGTPDAEIEKGMRKEHTERDDSHVKFSTANHGITTTPAKEWALVLEGGRGCDEVEEKEGSISVTSTRGCCKASGLKWLNTGNADPTTLCLKWQAFGDTQPTVGRQLTNSMLADALASKRSETEEEDQEQLMKVVDFTKEDWDIFSITDLRSSDFIEAGGAYFKTIASTAQVLANPRLAEALMHRTEFTQQEWDAFGVNGLRMHQVVKSGNSYFQPAGTEAQADVCVLRPITHYGDFGEDGRVRWGVGDELVVGEAFMITFVRRRSGLFVGDRGYDVEEKEELAKDTVGTVLEFNAEGAAKIAFREPVPQKSESKGGGFRSTTATTGAGFGAFGARTGATGAVAGARRLPRKISLP
jgi:hypothetical protein